MNAIFHAIRKINSVTSARKLFKLCLKRQIKLSVYWDNNYNWIKIQDTNVYDQVKYEVLSY